MEQKLKFLIDAEITDDKTELEMQRSSGEITYSYKACGGGGGCGGCGICGGTRKYTENHPHTAI